MLTHYSLSGVSPSRVSKEGGPGKNDALPLSVTEDPLNEA